MSKISVFQENESIIKIATEDNGSLYELDSYLSFYSSGYQFDRRYKNHIWDGKIHLISTAKRQTLAGLKTRIKVFCAEKHYSFEDLSESKSVEYSLDSLDDFIAGLKLPFEPRDYQKDAVIHALKNERCVMTSPTGSGKSLIQYIILRWYYALDKRIVLIVPSTSLVEQMIKDFKEYAQNDADFNVEEICKPLYSAKDTDPFEAKILISTWQSLMNYSSDLYEMWDVAMCDECHLAKAKIIKRIMTGALNARYRFGLTGSLSGDILSEYTLIGLFGEIFSVTTTIKLQEQGSLSPLKVYMLTLKHNKDRVKNFIKANETYIDPRTKEVKRGPSYPQEIDFLNGLEKRNLLIRNLALQCKGTTLLLFNRKEHGRLLFDLISAKAEDRGVFHIDGDVPATEREEIRTTIKNGKDCILVASTQTSATGIDIPSIENVIIFPTKSRIRNLQSIGRGLRVRDGKEYCNCFVVCDDFSNYSRRKSYSVKHGYEQYRIFTEEKFNVIFKTIEEF